MRFERESWRKLYVVESVEHRLLPLFTRALRDYLLRVASDDGTLLKSTKAAAADLARVLTAEPSEKKQIEKAIEQLIAIEYLTLSRGRLTITKFVEAQAAKSPGAKRQANYRDRHRNGGSDDAGNATEASPGNVTNNVTSDETRRDETRRDPPAPAATPVADVVADSAPDPKKSGKSVEEPVPTQLSEALLVPIASRARRVLDDPYTGQFLWPSKWPEVQSVATAWSKPFGIREIRLRDTVQSDRDLKAILEAMADGYTVADLERAGELAKTDDYLSKQGRKGGPSSFSAGVLRRLLADALPAAPGAADLGEYGESTSWG